MIDWKKYIDHIYIVDYIKTNKSVSKNFNSELKRVGIDRNDQSFVTTFININTPIYQNLFNNFFNNSSWCITEYTYAVDVTLAHYYCMKLAQANNYNKILILENDAIFYNDSNTIEYILNNAIDAFNYNMIDLFLGGSGCIGINGSNIDYSDTNIYTDINYKNHCCFGATFNIYNKKAYNYFIDFIESGKIAVIDEYGCLYHESDIKIGLSNIYLCVQCFWDIVVGDLYSHYNIKIKPPKKRIIETFNFLKDGGFWCDFRNAKKIFCECLEHYNLQEKYKNEYKLIKSNIFNYGPTK